MYMRKFGLSIVGLLLTYMGFAAPVVTDITAKQRFPWNGLVDITVTLSGAEEECKAATWAFYATNKATNAGLPVMSVKTVGVVTGEGNQWTRRFVWYAAIDVGKAKFGEVVLTVGEQSMEGVQLWENGPYWAECNVGATRPEACGYYFWWGDTVGYERNAKNDDWVSVKDRSSYSFNPYNRTTHDMSDSELLSAGHIGEDGNLAAKYDAATVYLGMQWRMPTRTELGALVSNCDQEWTTLNGVWGVLVKGRGAYATRSIFLPAAGSAGWHDITDFGSKGVYWSSTPNSDGRAWYLLFKSQAFYREQGWRCYGFPVRPVRGFVQ